MADLMTKYKNAVREEYRHKAFVAALVEYIAVLEKRCDDTFAAMRAAVDEASHDRLRDEWCRLTADLDASRESLPECRQDYGEARGRANWLRYLVDLHAAVRDPKLYTQELEDKWVFEWGREWMAPASDAVALDAGQLGLCAMP